MTSLDHTAHSTIAVSRFHFDPTDKMAFYPGRFDGRVAIITGGADGLGKGIAKRLVAEGGKVGSRPNYSRSGVSRRQE